MVRRPSAFSGQTMPFSGPWRATDSILIAIAALVGFAFVFILPPFDGTDELYHWLRVVQISSGHLLAPSMGPNAWGGEIDKHAYDFELWFLAKFQHGDTIQAGDAWTLARQLAALPPQNALVEFSSTASFSPLAYLPQSVGVALAHAVGANLLTQLYAGRIANLLVYLAGAVATLRLLPYGRLPFFILATMPTAIELAATQSADPLNFMLPALFIAWCWKYRNVERANKPPIGIVLAGFTIGLALLKPLYMIFAVFSVIIPASRFGGSRRKFIGIACALLIGVTLCAVWNWAYPFVPGKYWHTGADPVQMISAVIADPAMAFHMAATDFDASRELA